MKKLQKASIFFFILPLLAGSTSLRVRKKPSYPHLVTQIRVVCQQDTFTLTRNYSQSSKIKLVLDYLRLLRRQGFADTDPEQLTNDSYQITLYYSDGQSRVYHQRGNRYLSRNYQPWEKIDPEQALWLQEIVEYIPSDP